ncbi:RHS repeat-associated core domain-containing protein [Dysgonomonas sp. 521]|uniref:DUF6443 domain-containing protein n=1 Tax=Dysgonomonas sp. 521 TaxID=2302932 RepID=UPI0013D1E4F4|nr:DUF6443 domain-containing protein [Dysgonomonas sp. 521]NDV97147.1 RHS repeat-associated core domain-containing protein [Dysgonomonas sp. 521]
MKRLLYHIILLLCSTSLWSQAIITLNTARTTGGTETACKGISLKPDFSFKSTDSTSLSLKVNPTTCDPYAGKASAVSANQNYIQTRTYTTDNGSRYMESIQYFDGLGRPLQTVQRAVTPNTADLVTYQEYDPFGRDGRAWLPTVAAGNNGAFVSHANYKAKAMTTYKSTTYNTTSDSVAYSRPVYEASPLNRVVEQYGPGMDWQKNGKAVKTAYLTNTTSGELVCKKFGVGGSGTATTLAKSGNYAASQLYVTRMTDENENVSYEFKDKLGQVVLTRQISGTAHDTYYVYDNFGNLCYVLPPELSDKATADGTVSASLIDLWGYQYKYDGRNRCIIKKLPGTEKIYYVYDKADRLIFTQDGEQRNRKTGTKSEWTFTKYDAFGRVIISGIYRTDASHASLQTTYKNVVFKELVGTGNFGYSWNYLSGAIENKDVLLVNYFDYYTSVPDVNDYKNRLKYVPQSGYGAQHTSAKGQLVATRVKNIKSDNSTVHNALGESGTFFYYDNRGRLIQTHSTNHLGGVESEYIAYNFTGQPVKKMHVHTKDANGGGKQTEVYAYTYDHAGRLLKTTHQLNSGITVTLASNTYDELGRLKTNQKHTHANLKTTYGYNIRSWTKTIASPMFTQTLYYNEAYGIHGKQYNGNISAMTWKVGSEALRSYAFKYDNLSRLTHAAYGNVSSGGMYSASYGYDKHGNMKSLTRRGKKTSAADDNQAVDQLTMTYTGNQLTKAEDAVANFAYAESADFKNYSNVATEYTYNKNGAMAKDLNKGITAIQYNSLNLPRMMDIKSPVAEARNEYTYSASGAKLKVVQKWNPNFSTAPVIGSAINTAALTMTKTTDYVGNKVYENNALKRILVDGGYIEGTTYHFYMNDHLGNNRVVANASGTAIQKNHYYPFGTAFAETSKTEQGKQPYKYNGKELDAMHGVNLYDYSARYMDSQIGRFTSVDPLAEKYYSISPYAYCNNNPLKYIDPTGMSPDTARVYTETIRGGHAWISVGEGDDMIVYSYGPMTSSYSKGHAITGKGLLSKYTGTAAKGYLDQKMKDTDMTSVTITDVSESTIQDIIENIIDGGKKVDNLIINDYTTEVVDRQQVHTVTGLKVPYNVGDSYGSYNVLTNNCTTFVSDVLNQAGSSVLKDSRTVIDRKHGDVYRVPINSRFILPSSLRSALKK